MTNLFFKFSGKTNNNKILGKTFKTWPLDVLLESFYVPGVYITYKKTRDIIAASELFINRKFHSPPEGYVSYGVG